MTIQQYLTILQERFASGISTEHSYRGDLQQLLETLLSNYNITNEPRRSKVGAPDYIITEDTVARGYIEAKDIDKSLDDKLYKEQFTRYREGLPNLIITNYHEFRLYQDGNFIKKIHLAYLDPLTNEIEPNPKAFGEFEALIKDFPTHIAQTIRSSKKLSELMASKARLLKEVFSRALKEDIADEHKSDTELQQQYNSFRELLIRDIDPDQFADLYAQTIAYGMFAARSKDPSLDTFNRQEAAELIPKTNPFLRKLFHYIAGYDLDIRISWIIDGLADVFRATDVEGILHNFGKYTKMQDPIIHFYEDFLKEYDPGLRVERGVWYTPLPVVQFIVRAVDYVLKQDFNLTKGLADNSKIDIDIETETKKTADRRSVVKKVKGTKEVHRVQILDPATGTGTFLAEVVRNIYSGFEGMEGMWPQYVNQDLIPRLNGFELLMASYAMAHLKLDLLLQETGYSHTSKYVSKRDGLFAKDGAGLTQERFNIFLTNSLEPGIKEVPNLFMNQWLTTESQEASRIKTQTPVMVVLGNPPYSGVSANKGKYILNLLKDYKKEPGGKQKLQERKHWLNDDYVKFLRLAQNMVQNTKEGVVAYINPHGFLDNPTFRGMRWHLLKTFDKIYTIDLHGNSNKKETSPDGTKDENVFDIQQGVSINIFIKTGDKEKSDLGQIYHCDLFGKRKDKYKFLEEKSLKDIDFTKVPNVAPDYFMVPKDYSLNEEFKSGFNLEILFPIFSTGIVTMGDGFIIGDSKLELKDRIEELLESEISEESLKNKYSLGKNYARWILSNLVNISNIPDEAYVPISQKPFDYKYTVFDNSVIWRWRKDVMFNLAYFENLAIVLPKQNKNDGGVFITNTINTHKLVSAYDSNYTFVLYNYINSTSRTPNLNRKLIQQFAKGLGLIFLPDHDLTRLQEAVKLREEGEDAYSGWDLPENLKSNIDEFNNIRFFNPLNVLDYIYAVLHSPSYREKYAEFLKTDFPRLPSPSDVILFWELVALGGELREIHLMKHGVLEKSPVTYPSMVGDNVIERKITKTSPGWESVTEVNSKTSKKDVIGKVWINNQQYFDKVPKSAWEFYIGGYQPAQKWLKDRKSKTLSMEDVKHYQKIIKALMETERLMKEIDIVRIIVD